MKSLRDLGVRSQDEGRGTCLYRVSQFHHVAVIDAATMKVRARVKTDAGPVQVTVAPNQQYAYVANDGRGTLQKIDLATDQVVKTISLGRGAGRHGISFAAEGKFVLVTNTGLGTVSVIDTETDEVHKTVKVGVAPEGIAFKRP